MGWNRPLHGSLLAASRPTGARSDLARQYRRHYLLMGLSDTLAVGAALLLAYQLRFGRLLPPSTSGSCWPPCP